VAPYEPRRVHPPSGRVKVFLITVRDAHRAILPARIRSAGERAELGPGTFVEGDRSEADLIAWGFFGRADRGPRADRIGYRVPA